MEPSRIEIIGHRGARQNPVPGGPPLSENSLRALARAVELGADAVETDLALSRDGHILLQHDPTLDCGAGPRPVGELDWAEIRARHPETALLAEALEALPDRTLVLELKRHTDVAAILEGMRDPGIAPHHHRLRFISFHRDALRAAGRAFPGIPRAFIATSREGRFDPLMREGHIRQCLEDGCAEICGHWRLVFASTARRAREAGLRLGLGPVNSGAAWNRCRRLGADRLYTDKVAELAARRVKPEN